VHLSPGAAGLLIPLFLYSYNAAIYHRNGRLLWFSPRWIASNRITQDELLGLRYLEFLDKGEAQRVIAWLADEADTLITYRFYSPSRGNWTHCTQAKIRYGDGDFWLCLGERWETG
jgi:hypothetical protein